MTAARLFLDSKQIFHNPTPSGVTGPHCEVNVRGSTVLKFPRVCVKNPGRTSRGLKSHRDLISCQLEASSNADILSEFPLWSFHVVFCWFGAISVHFGMKLPFHQLSPPFITNARQSWLQVGEAHRRELHRSKELNLI